MSELGQILVTTWPSAPGLVSVCVVVFLFVRYQRQRNLSQEKIAKDTADIIQRCAEQLGANSHALERVVGKLDRMDSR